MDPRYPIGKFSFSAATPTSGQRRLWIDEIAAAPGQLRAAAAGLNPDQLIPRTSRISRHCATACDGNRNILFDMKSALAILFTVGILAAQQPDGAGVNSPWSPAEVIHAGDMAKMLGKNQPLTIHVGFDKFYNSKHVPGSIYAGPGRTEEGLAALKKAVANVPKTAQIVLYCGCCPWDHCPNMKPAYKLLRGLGYTKIKVVEIPDSFAKNWIEKGYPVEGGAASRN